jgi:hypothetical protein
MNVLNVLIIIFFLIGASQILTAYAGHWLYLIRSVINGVKFILTRE